MSQQQCFLQIACFFIVGGEQPPRPVGACAFGLRQLPAQRHWILLWQFDGFADADLPFFYLGNDKAGLAFGDAELQADVIVV